jgi:hypothetical protein
MALAISSQCKRLSASIVPHQTYACAEAIHVAFG